MQGILLTTSMLAVGAGLVMVAIGVMRNRAARLTTSAADMILDDGYDYHKELSEPFVARLLGPALESFQNAGRRLTPTWQKKRMQRNASLAGFGRRGVESILALKVVAAIAVGLTIPALLALFGANFGGVLMWAVLGGVIGFFIPDLWIARRGTARQHAIRQNLPEVLDLMAIAVQAGMGLEGAIELVSRKLPGPLGDELHRLLQEVQLGASRRQALQNLRDRTEVMELSTFALALIQADTVGSPIAEVLQAHAGEMRMLRRQRAREQAAKLPVKLLFPLLFTIFPALMIIVLGPAALGIVHAFF
jgi:tight adherence protein C